jgi:hypothetical protein
MTDQPCACISIDTSESYDDGGHETRVAGIERKCCECNRVIEVGEHYEAAWGGYIKYDDDDNEILYDVDEYETCVDCESIVDAFFCHGRLYYGVWEMLNEHLDEMVVFGNGISSSCIEPLTDAARAKVCDMIEERWDDDDDEE